MGKEPSRTLDVFLSYSSKDKGWADAACAVLEQNQIRCWIAPRDIIPGDEWGAAIIKGISDSRIMVLIFSGHANESMQVRREVERALNRRIPILPIRIEDVLPQAAMEYALGNTHWLDAFTPPLERHLDHLARSVKALLEIDATALTPSSAAIVVSDAIAGNPPSARAATPAAPLRPTEPAVASQRRWQGKPGPIAIAASLIGLVALGLIITTFKTSQGEPKIAAKSGSTPKVAPEKKDLAPNRDKPRVQVAPLEPFPSKGPARLASNIKGGEWSIEGEQLVKQGLGFGQVTFGNPAWDDFDFSFDFLHGAGTDGIGGSFRVDGGQAYKLILGGMQNYHFLHHGVKGPQGGPKPRAIHGTIQPNRWYSVRISARGPQIRAFLDDLQIFNLSDHFRQNGEVALQCWKSSGRFRNIRVTAKDGTVLWQGPPDLPASTGE